MPIGLKVLGNSEAKITSDGGYAIRMINKTGAPSIKGYVVEPSPTTDKGVQLIRQDIPDPIGVFLDDGVPDGKYAWIVISGKAYVYYTSSATRGYLSRGFVAVDAGFVAGQALNEPLPASPFASDKHFYEIGHVLESRIGAGLALTDVHFN
jgi:hypothetical protein